MSKLKLTPWFSGDTKPLPKRTGLYERDYSLKKDGSEVRLSWWNGLTFGISAISSDDADRFMRLFGVSLAQNLPWRGVMK